MVLCRFLFFLANRKALRCLAACPPGRQTQMLVASEMARIHEHVACFSSSKPSRRCFLPPTTAPGLGVGEAKAQVVGVRFRDVSRLQPRGLRGRHLQNGPQASAMERRLEARGSGGRFLGRLSRVSGRFLGVDFPCPFSFQPSFFSKTSSFSGFWMVS